MIPFAGLGVVLAVGFAIAGQWMGALASFACVPLFALGHRGYAKDWRKKHPGDL